jgi:hypothetical protein
MRGPDVAAAGEKQLRTRHAQGTDVRRPLARGETEKRGVELSIEKPVVDLTPPPRFGTEGKEPAPHEPIIPDFIVRATSGRSVVVETMGYEQSAYRARKTRMHPAMSKACRDALVLEHDFYLPVDWSQADRDGQFWRAGQRALAHLIRRDDA